MLDGKNIIILSKDEAGKLLILIRTLAAGVDNDLIPFTKDELIQYRSLDSMRLISNLKSMLKEEE